MVYSCCGTRSRQLLALKGQTLMNYILAHKGAHGLSLLVTTEIDNEKHTFMFDCGPESKSIDRNVKALGVDLTQVDAIALSVRSLARSTDNI